MKPLPPPETKPGSLHVLHRQTGAHYWMLAEWTGSKWKTQEGERTPEYLVWWHYAGPFVTPADVAALRATLREARVQIKYLHEKFQETGSGNGVLARIDAALAQGGE
ncbi:MAG: hypothetical protein JSS56_25155 [Proteobacteria bacterium]|nr:hypothetical protein [Pseudomonadota bacterium]